MWTMRGWLWVVIFVCTGCGGVYEDFAPSRKGDVPMVVVPDFVRVGDDLRQLDLVIDVDPEGAFVTGLFMGRGLEIIAFDSRENRGCGVSTPPDVFAGRRVFRLCVSVRVEAWAQVGMHEVVVDLSHPTGYVIGRAPLFVLGRLQ